MLSDKRDVGADAGFGIRQLVDIADRALSPGINDPTTAVQAVNELHIVFRTLAQLRDPTPHLVTGGRVVAVYRPQGYAALLRDTVEELMHHAQGAPRVRSRLRSVLEELLDVARPEHRAATRAALAHVDDAA